MRRREQIVIFLNQQIYCLIFLSQSCNNKIHILSMYKHFYIEKGTDVDTWTLEELEDVVSEFKLNYGPMYD